MKLTYYSANIYVRNHGIFLINFLDIFLHNLLVISQAIFMKIFKEKSSGKNLEINLGNSRGEFLEITHDMKLLNPPPLI